MQNEFFFKDCLSKNLSFVPFDAEPACSPTSPCLVAQGPTILSLAWGWVLGMPGHGRLGQMQVMGTATQDRREIVDAEGRKGKLPVTSRGFRKLEGMEIQAVKGKIHLRVVQRSEFWWWGIDHIQHPHPTLASIGLHAGHNLR